MRNARLYLALLSLVAILAFITSQAATSETEPPSTISYDRPLKEVQDPFLTEMVAYQERVTIYVAAVEKAEAEQAAIWLAAKAAEAEERAAAEAAERAAAARRAERARVEAATPPAAPRAVSGDVWSRLAQCESGNRNVNTGNGYYGYFQFSAQTWRSVGGTGLPSDHGYGEQLSRAQALQARSGWGQWPGCSRQLGLR